LLGARAAGFVPGPILSDLLLVTKTERTALPCLVFYSLRSGQARQEEEASPASGPIPWLERFVNVRAIVGRRMSELWLIRHGETEWTVSGAHTGRTDIPLTATGRQQASAIGRWLAGREFSLVLVSPLQRARETCRLAGYAAAAQIDSSLREWDYGEDEGRTTAEIQRADPGWSLWDDGPHNGETVEQVGARADAVIARAVSAPGDVALFAHGHLLRILAARWLGLAPSAGRLFALSTATVSTLGYERDTRVITRWNLSPPA
jgi:probable phosphoglycerate mutase